MESKYIILVIAIVLIIGIIYYPVGTEVEQEIAEEEEEMETEEIVDEPFQEEAEEVITETTGVQVKFDTSKGDIVIELASDMPITTANFIGLVEDGTYDGVIFHRVIPGFMIQGGDPTGTGYGDSSIPTIQDEFTSDNANDRGTISMANRGPNTGSSQFFINLVDNNFLDTAHPAFGVVVEGMDIVDAIALVETGEADRPLEDVVILHASVV